MKLKNGDIKLLPWGRRQDQAGATPLGGWARHDSVQRGVWDQYMPKPVKLPILKFMEKDFEGHSHWFDITPGQWIQGLLTYAETEPRIYIVTIIPELEQAIHERWPRVMSG